MELKAGGANAGILDKPAADYFVATDGKGAFRVVDVPDSKVQYFAFGFNKDNKELQQEVNAAIAKLKKDGTLNRRSTGNQVILKQAYKKGCVPNGSHPF